MKNCVLFDIDGTLANIEHRLHFIEKSPKDWNGFFNAVPWDIPIDYMIKLLRTVSKDNSIVIVTGRPERTKRDTVIWLDTNINVPWHGPYMRKDNDSREDTIVKFEILEQLQNDCWFPTMVFDDRARVVEMWRKCGIPCMQVAEGNF